MLDEVLTALVTAGGTAVVQAMASDAWDEVRARLVRLFHRSTTHQQQVIADQLTHDRESLLRLPEEKLDAARTRLAITWETRLTDLITADPAAAEQLRDVIRMVDGSTSTRATITGSAGAVIEDSGNIGRGTGSTAAAIDNSPEARISNSGNVG